MSEGSVEEESRFENCPPYGDDYGGCTCGLLQLLGFSNRIGRTIKTGQYVRLNSTDRKKNSSKKFKDHEIPDESVSKKDQLVLFQKKEKDKGLRASSYKRNIKAWIKKRINRKSNNKQKLMPGSSRVSRTSSIHKSSCNSKFFQPKENIKEIGRTILDGILHKIPYGQKVPEEIIKGNKLFRSLSADYDSYTNKEKRGDLIDKSQGEKKYQRNFSSPAMVYEGKINDEKEDGKENMVNNCDELKEEKDEGLLDLVHENENENNDEIKEGGMILIEDGDILVSEQEGFVGEFFVEMDLESEIEEKDETNLESENEEKYETDLETEIEEKSEVGLESEIEIEEKYEMDLGTEIEEESEMDSETEMEEKSEIDFESGIGENFEKDMNLELKNTIFNAKGIEFVSILQKQLGLELDTTTQAQINEKIPILSSNITLEQFTEIWDQINQIEFSKFDCNLMSQDLILLFDLIDQVYKQVYTNPSSNIHWFLDYKSKLDSKSAQNAVLKEVQERVTWHLSDEKECSDEADDIIGNWDFVRYDDWFDFRGEIENLVDDLERFLLDDLIGELAIDLAVEVITK